MDKQEEIREGQAELEHEQWVKWSQSIAAVETLSPNRLSWWKKLWIPYVNLTEEQKDQDREWADISLAKLHSQGVVIIDKDRELPDNPTKVTPYLGLTVVEAREKNLENNCFVKVIQAHMLKAGYVAVKPLIEVKE